MTPIGPWRALIRTKTFWTGMAALLTVTGGYLAGEIDLGTLIETMTTGLVAIFLRHGMLKAEPR